VSGPHAGGSVADALLVHAHSPVHRLPGQVKVASVLLFVLAVVAIPREQFWAFGVAALLLVGVARVARVPVPLVGRRLVVELPFVLFAVALPFLGGGERVDVAGLALSVEGLYGAFNILAKATLGTAAALLLTATTPVRDLLAGLERLGLPRQMVAIATFMVRYVDVVLAEVGRMRVARISRGDDPRFLWQAKAVAATAGTLFVRSYERGERVHVAMLSRGYDGRFPAAVAPVPTRGQWLTGLVLPVLGVLLCLAAWLVHAAPAWLPT
jgi:cobalt/nickel transport system permease protein